MHALTESLSLATRVRRYSALVVLAFAGILLLKGLKPNRFNLLSQTSSHNHIARPPITSELAMVDSATGSDSDAAHELEIQITGYWKEVRASLGLPPLPDAVVVPLAFDLLSIGDPTEALGHASAEDKRHLRRVGRLNPALRRRRLLFAPPSPFSRSRDHEVQGGAHQAGDSVRAVVGSGQPMDTERMQDHGSEAADLHSDGLHDTGPSSVSRVDAYPNLFIASDAHSTPRTPVGALAASFRAIALRELKAKAKHHGSAHLRHDKRMLQ